MSDPIDAVLQELMQKTDGAARRAIRDDRPELIEHTYELATLTERLARAFDLPSPLDPDVYIADLKKHFLLATTLTVVPGIFSDDAIATPIDPVPLRQNSRSKLGVGLAEHRLRRVAIDAPCYRPDHRCYGFIVPAEPLDCWYMVREQGDLSYVMALAHEWISSSGSAVITPAENGSGFFTLGTLISLQAGLSFPVSSVISLGGALGVDFLIRFPLEFQNQVQADQNSALGWFFGSGRFFYPETRIFLRWHISEPVDLLLNFRAFYPVFHLWDGSGQPFWDALMVSGGIGFAIRMRPAAAAK